MFENFTARYRKLPRTGRWGFWFAVVLIAYFGVIEPAVNWSVEKAHAAEKLEKSLAARTKLGADSGASNDVLQRSIVAFGAPKTPRNNLPDPMGYLSQKTADIAQKHEITVKRRTRRNNTPIVNFDWNGAKLERVTLELVVECDTDKFMAMLKDLESSPDITDITSVKMNKLSEPGVSLSDSTLMQITLVPEMWIVAGSGNGSAAITQPEPAPEKVDPAIDSHTTPAPTTPAALPAETPANPPAPATAPATPAPAQPAPAPTATPAAPAPAGPQGANP